MATSKKTDKNQKSDYFVKKLTKLDQEYRAIQAHISLLTEQLHIKEDEINAFLAENCQPK